MNRHAMLARLMIVASAAALLHACDEAPAPTTGPDGIYIPAAGDPPLKGAAIGGEFELVDTAGKTVRWSDFEGKYRIVYFGFAYCPDICPTDVQRMIQGLSMVEDRRPELAARIQPIFISVDTERDTPEIVGQFTSAFSDGLIGLTGSAEAIKQAADAFGVYYSRGAETPDGGYLIDHSNLTYLFGPSGEPLATLPTDLGPEAVAAEIEKWAS